jgi:hypothetical protein
LKKKIEIVCSIDGFGNETRYEYRVSRIVIEWAQRIYVVERRIELFHGEQELGEEAKTKNITGKDR